MKSLVVAPAWIGDMMMASPLVAALAGLGEVHIVAPPATAPVARRMPSAAAVHELSVHHGGLQLPVRYRLGRQLRRVGFDRAYVLPNTFKSALVPWFARIPERIGYLGEQRYGVLNDIRRLDPAALPRLVDRYRALAGDTQPLPRVTRLPPLRVDHANFERLSALFRLDATPAVCLCPGAEFGPAKRWPAAHFAELARRCLDSGLAVWLLGAENDRAVCADIARQVPAVVDLAGRTRLADAIDLLAAAEVVVSNDSGLMHVASALARPVISLFGSTSAEFTPPLGDRATVLETELECRPCFQRTCPLHHLRCLTELRPAMVADKIAEAVA